MRDNDKKIYYQALLNKDSEFDGIFYVGVKTTGVFCRPTCPARKPKFENCEFFKTAKEALIASYRPCQRCRPLLHPHQISDTVQKLVQAVEENPGIIRNRLKIQSIILNAKAMLDLQRKYGGLSDYLWNFVDGKPIKHHWKTSKQIPTTNSISE